MEMGTMENAHMNTKISGRGADKNNKGGGCKNRNRHDFNTPVNKERLPARLHTFHAVFTEIRIVAEIGPRCRLDGNEPRRPASVP